MTERNHNTLTGPGKLAIIQRHAQKESPATLSTIYGIAQPTVYTILNEERIEKFMKAVADKAWKSEKLKP